MTKMASCLFRSRDIFLKCPLIFQPKNCTNCIKWCESQKIKRISSKCCCEVVPIWENNTTSIRTSCWHGRNTQYTYHAYNQGNPGQKSQTTYHSHITETKCVACVWLWFIDECWSIGRGYRGSNFVTVCHSPYQSTNRPICPWIPPSLHCPMVDMDPNPP